MKSKLSCAAIVSIAACAMLLTGCGLGPGNPPTGVSLTITHDFGAKEVGKAHANKVVGRETVMSFLERHFTVATRYGGRDVQSIESNAGQDGSQPLAWFYYVNGIEAPKGAAKTDLYPGDRVWWDLHDYSQAEKTPAVVGSFPEPFTNGTGGRRYPVTVECSNVNGAGCKTVTNRLRALEVPTATSAIDPAYEPEVLRILVAPWSVLRGFPIINDVAQGPRSSGVYARLSSTGSTLTLLDQEGAAVRTLTQGAGLVAATRYHEEAPIWIVTGTDERGVNLAADDLDSAALEDHFAVAVTSGQTIALPVPEG